ncbi:ChrR family anti-sigma-E factor [Sinorhizobium sp. A49]|uniref:ChrR family anti-sigma-E factor n=1 Tax=Sinorhizobium sp. A49 TaxID=1945861 RepID=UPI0009847F05|nr:ChrR family anti-sigma-E factor [Sinorhizobium sp. A49]OOG69058.1 transcriptional regulator [Sinorhizobium sp. A49]
MSINHHVSDELLLRYASGELAEGWSLAVATHLALCPSCRQRLAKMETIGGALLENISMGTASDDAWARMRSRIDKMEAPVSRPKEDHRQVPGAMPILPEPLRSYLGGDIDSLKWRSLGMGAYQIPIRLADASTIARLLRIPAGKPVPEHGHAGQELTLVLAGSFRDGSDVFARGDLEEADASLTHQPLASEGEDCICLAVTDAPLKFKSWLVRLIQPVLGI